MHSFDVSDRLVNFTAEELEEFYINDTATGEKILDTFHPVIKEFKIDVLRKVRYADATRFDEVGQYFYRFMRFTGLIQNRANWGAIECWMWSYFKNSTLPHTVFPYRYGSYYIYEANNATNQFKVATWINVTSNEVANFYP